MRGPVLVVTLGLVVPDAAVLPQPQVSVTCRQEREWDARDDLLIRAVQRVETHTVAANELCGIVDHGYLLQSRGHPQSARVIPDMSNRPKRTTGSSRCLCTPSHGQRSARSPSRSRAEVGSDRGSVVMS